MKDLETMDNAVLRQYYANACSTYYGAIGHHKSEMNYNRASAYQAELLSRGDRVPAFIEASYFGTYNGEGSY
jgi:hypothetical protein